MMQPISELEKSRRAHLLSQEVVIVTEDEGEKSSEVRFTRQVDGGPLPSRKPNTKPKYNNNKAKVRRKLQAISRKKNRKK